MAWFCFLISLLLFAYSRYQTHETRMTNGADGVIELFFFLEGLFWFKDGFLGFGGGLDLKAEKERRAVGYSRFFSCGTETVGWKIKNHSCILQTCRSA
jgi:hypothetical protein